MSPVGRKIDPPLQVGDIITNSQGHRMECVGFTKAGKARMKRDTGTEITGWWQFWLPYKYKLHRLDESGELL